MTNDRTIRVPTKNDADVVFVAVRHIASVEYRLGNSYVTIGLTGGERNVTAFFNSGPEARQYAMAVEFVMGTGSTS